VEDRYQEPINIRDEEHDSALKQSRRGSYFWGSKMASGLKKTAQNYGISVEKWKAAWSHFYIGRQFLSLFPIIQ